MGQRNECVVCEVGVIEGDLEAVVVRAVCDMAKVRVEQYQYCSLEDATKDLFAALDRVDTYFIGRASRTSQPGPNESR